MRELRGAILRAMLEPDPPADVASLLERVRQTGAAQSSDAVVEAFAALDREGMLSAPLRG